MNFDFKTKIMSNSISVRIHWIKNKICSAYLKWCTNFEKMYAGAWTDYSLSGGSNVKLNGKGLFPMFNEYK